VPEPVGPAQMELIPTPRSRLGVTYSTQYRRALSCALAVESQLRDSWKFCPVFNGPVAMGLVCSLSFNGPVAS